MDTENKETKTTASQVIGYILLVPPVLSVPLFVIQFFLKKERAFSMVF